MSNKLKKIVASVMTVASLVVCTAGMSVSAANGKLTVDSSSATLYNESGATRYGNVNFTGQIVKSSATQSEKKFLKHLEGSQEIKTFARAIVDEINNTL